MQLATMKLRVSAPAICALLFGSLAISANGATNGPGNEPSYNPATTVAASGIVTAVREVPAGQPLEGVHLTIKNKTTTMEIYVAPLSFLKFLRANFVVGNDLDVVGSKVRTGAMEVILAKEINDGKSTIELRNGYGAEAWKNWGVEADPATLAAQHN
jgi:hypothetical protein